MHKKIIHLIGTLDEFLKQAQRRVGAAKRFDKLTVSQLIKLTKAGAQLFSAKFQALQVYGEFVQNSLNKKEAFEFEKALDKLIKKSSAHSVKGLK
jgi:hypothetical protein